MNDIKKYKVSDKQYEFLRQLRADLNPLDEMDDNTLCKVLTDREYSDFQRAIIKNLRARWIREQGLHNNLHDTTYEEEISSLNRRGNL